MVLAIDIGNTNIVIGCFKGDEIFFESRINTDAARMADQYSIIIADVFRLYNVEMKDIEGAIVSSVVPPVTVQIKESLKMLFGRYPMVIGPGLKTGLNIKIDDPSCLGSDIACTVIAAKKKYPLPCLVIDLGTANKIFALDKDGSLVGGIIAPGIQLSFNSLAAGAAALPLIGIDSVDHVIGTNTPDSMRSGIIIGTACMIDGFIKRFEEVLGPCSIVATGGFSHCVEPHCERRFDIRPNLVLEGLKYVYERNTKTR